MMISKEKAANAMGGKTARACDGCLRKRARWYCVADDAFLCQACDASVHSANQLASRHERVRLEAVSTGKINNGYNNKDSAAPVWHQGFTRKARTPRPNNNKAMVVRQKKDSKVLSSNSYESLVVPEIGCEEGSFLQDDVTEEQLLYHQVPVFDPPANELGCESIMVNGEENLIGDDGNYAQVIGTCDFDDLHGFLPSDMDLAEFAADVESLLGNGLDQDSYDVNESGLSGCNKEEKLALKIKDEEVEGVAVASHFDHGFITTTREAKIDWNFDYDDDHSQASPHQVPEMKKRNISLKLNYDAVITAWASQGCPWTTGTRPDFNNPNDDCWPDCNKGAMIGCHNMGSSSDGGGREARVSRYREKRRTRLFSKKIRYEVRKLNAEKRPRMKGRFVKSTSFVGTNNNAFPCYLSNH